MFLLVISGTIRIFQFQRGVAAKDYVCGILVSAKLTPVNPLEDPFNQFEFKVTFLHHLKTLENHRLSDASMGYKNVILD